MGSEHLAHVIATTMLQVAAAAVAAGGFYLEDYAE